MNMSIRSRVVITAAAVALLATACGSDDSSSTATTAAPAATSAASTAAPATTGAAATTAAPADDGYGASPTTAGAATTGAPAGDGVAVELADTSLGNVLTSDGLTLYIFTPDNAGPSTCVDDCAAAWPPLTTDGAAAPGAGLDADDFATVARADGSTQVTFYGWPLYTFGGDKAPGDVNGQGIGGKWYVVGADGTAITAG
jgi:predicted lipoprotein with Yx(FWY)xxD motif